MPSFFLLLEASFIPWHHYQTKNNKNHNLSKYPLGVIAGRIFPLNFSPKEMIYCDDSSKLEKDII